MTAQARITPYVATTVAEAAALLDIHRATLSDFLRDHPFFDETPGGRKKFTAGHIALLKEAYYKCRSPETKQALSAFEEANERVASEPRGRKTYIYFAHCAATNLMKIGVSDDPLRRIEDLTKKTGLALALYHVTEGSFTEEKRLHEQFSSLRREGEYFAYEGALKDYVEAL